MQAIQVQQVTIGTVVALKAQGTPAFTVTGQKNKNGAFCVESENGWGFVSPCDVVYVETLEEIAAKIVASEKQAKLDLIPNCGMCAGRGVIECYKHYKGGMCFTCNGTGKR